MMAERESSEVITFYSYKGGTGRSMALANVACILARRQAESQGKGVLMIDWDLEAPGLHRFFRDHLGGTEKPEDSPPEREGLIDLLWKLREFAESIPASLEEAPDQSESAFRDAVEIENYIVQTDIPSLAFLKAGRIDEDYPERVNTFPWEGLYQRAPWLLPWFIKLVGRDYRYVLVDSRTGVTDISGICTILLPEKLVVVFTPNRQSLEGARDLVRRALRHRASSDDLRPLRVFPLPSRVEPARPGLQRQWRFDAPIGYQPVFESLFRELYSLAECDLTSYFDEIQIQHVPDYAYGEEIAALREETGDRLSLARSYETFAERLESMDTPWEQPRPKVSRDPRGVALALGSVLQSICLEFHVMRFLRDLPIGREAGERAFGESDILEKEQFRLVRGWAEWKVKLWVNSDLSPEWQKERDRLASEHLPGISYDTGVSDLLLTALGHVLFLLYETSRAVDTPCEVNISRGWSAWVNLGLRPEAGLRAREAESSYDYDKGTLQLEGPLSGFRGLLKIIDQRIRSAHAYLEALDTRAPSPENGHERTVVDLAIILGGTWEKLVAGKKSLFERILAGLPEGMVRGHASARTISSLFECNFERWLRDAAVPDWRASQAEMRARRMDLPPALDFIGFLKYYLNTISELLNTGLRNLGNFDYEGGFAISKEDWEVAGEAIVVPPNLRADQASWSSGEVRLKGKFEDFILLFNEATRRLVGALREAQPPRPGMQS